MATSAVSWLRNYLAARDLPSEVAGGLAVEQAGAAQLDAGRSVVGPRVVPQVDVDHLSARPMLLERIPAPLPAPLRQAAQTFLIAFGALFAVGALYVLGGALAVVLMPIMLGREGVGTAMITLFSVCITAMATGILLLAARSAARVIRRERRGVRSLYLFVRTGLFFSIVAAALTQWLSVAFQGLSFTDSDAVGFDWSIPVRAAEIFFIVLFLWGAAKVRPYARKDNQF